jgi:hypothetical protein
MFDISGRMPTRQPKSAIELAAKSAEAIKQAAQNHRSDEKRLVDTMYSNHDVATLVCKGKINQGA